ncbi:hypothetical protein [Pseudochelatococcus sp. G4_1912]|uniref:hypothetical protein n=1 Tax=Pseudochelatococcus sp. G4_1912 TaxID=3114288 RepID=UPI0039C67414
MTGSDTSGPPIPDDVIDIDAVLHALDRDLERRLSIAQRLEPILRDIVAYYGVPTDNWHSFGLIFQLGNKDTSQTGLQVGGMALRASGSNELHRMATSAHAPHRKTDANR